MNRPFFVHLRITYTYISIAELNIQPDNLDFRIPISLHNMTYLTANLDATANVDSTLAPSSEPTRELSDASKIGLSVSVIIPTINEAANVERAVISALDAGASEVIVVDGGSCDQTPAIAKATGALVLHSSAGRAIQQNAGAISASGDVLLFLHADSILTPETIPQLLESLHGNPNIIGGGFEQKINADRFVFRMLEWGNRWRAKLQNLYYGDQAIFIRKLEFETLGGFQEIPLMEDFDLSCRMSAQGILKLLKGPVVVNPRRWNRIGVVRQTVLNWTIALLYRCGVSPKWLAQQYKRHDS